MSKYLLIGGAGFIGAAIAKKLVLAGNEVSILELPGSYVDRLDVIKEKINLYYGNLNQVDVIKDLILENDINVVLHLASSLIPSSSQSQYVEDIEKVVIPTINLLPLFSELNIKLIFFSSGGAIYGENLNGSLSENHLLAPISYYGQAKLLMEESIKFESRKSGLDYIILRPSNPYGIGQSLYGKQGLIATCIHNILNRKTIQIWGDGSVVRDYIYIDDFVEIVINVINMATSREIYNIGSGNGHSVNEIIEMLKKIVDKTIEVEYVQNRAVDASSIILDISKLKNIINFEYTSLETGIKNFLLYESSDKPI
ncbi:NAD-dependent epimerase/dehydratase family protein [Flavobacterium aquidurense]|uniref:NAD-dependent epimerase/dehydratase family protein n=1 Tax=Flavobacterium aquidurense TaxID=362413 RepID=A0A0Q0W4J5_9FLAO|nr:NAD-dependent epimerase/dehydratase family protein [Flavobacterium aquidurense]KQB41541.1 NAD-dependent epimerase/dehydratase family protein [Flavobacterium aquidurense]